MTRLLIGWSPFQIAGFERRDRKLGSARRSVSTSEPSDVLAGSHSGDSQATCDGLVGHSGRQELQNEQLRRTERLFHGSIPFVRRKTLVQLG